MSEQKKTQVHINEEEIKVLKKYFAEEDEILLSIRSLLMGDNVTHSECEVIRSIFSDLGLRVAFRKKLYPLLDRHSLLGQGGDYWFGTDTEIIGRDPETIKQIIQGKQNCFILLEAAMKLLANPFSDEKIDLSLELDFEKDPYQVSLIARNKYINAVNTALSLVKAVAGLKSDSVEETKKKILGDNGR